jgi:hypothetical protein
MIHAFTISFDFEGRTYMALASIKSSKDEDTAYSIRIYSTSLYRIFPDGILKYSGDGSSCIDGYKHPQAQPLFNCIHSSVCAHLKLAQQYQ